MQTSTIGLRQRIPMSILEMALTAVLSGNYSRVYFAELAATEYDGGNRIAKAVTAIAQLTSRNPLIEQLIAEKEDVLKALRSRPDRALIFTALLVSNFEFAYDLVSLLGKYFHVQDQVVTELIVKKMSEKYGSNRSLPNALYCALPMLIEAGILSRPKPGVYEMKRVCPSSSIALRIYNAAFFHWNTNLDQEQSYASHPFYEFVECAEG